MSKSKPFSLSKVRRLSETDKRKVAGILTQDRQGRRGISEKANKKSLSKPEKSKQLAMQVKLEVTRAFTLEPTNKSQKRPHPIRVLHHLNTADLTLLFDQIELNPQAQQNIITGPQEKQKYLFSDVSITYADIRHNIKISSCGVACLLRSYLSYFPQSPENEDSFIKRGIILSNIQSNTEEFQSPFDKNNGYVAATRKVLSRFFPSNFEIKDQTIDPKEIITALEKGSHIVYCDHGHYKLISGYRNENSGLKLVVNDSLATRHHIVDFKDNFLPILIANQKNYVHDVLAGEEKGVPIFIIGKKSD